MTDADTCAGKEEEKRSEANKRRHRVYACVCDVGPEWFGGRAQAERAEARHGDGHGAEALRRADARGRAAGSGAATLPPRELAGRASRRLGQNCAASSVQWYQMKLLSRQFGRTDGAVGHRWQEQQGRGRRDGYAHLSFLSKHSISEVVLFE